MGRMTGDLATLQCPGLAEPAGRPPRTTPSSGEADSEYVPACHGGRRGPAVWPVEYYLASRDIRVNRSKVPAVGGCSEPVPRRSRSRIFTGDVICHGTDTYVPSRLVTSPDTVWNRAISGAGVRTVDRPLR